MTKNTTSRTGKFSKTDADHLKSIESLISRSLDSGKITIEDSEYIRKFVRDVRATSLISPSRQNKIVQNLVYVRQFTPLFTECTTEDLKCAKLDLYDAVDESGNKRYTVNTQNDWLKTLKRFLIWMGKKGYSSIDTLELRDFKPTSPQKITKSPDDMLTEDEVLNILQACRNSRDRCIISMLYEGALRIGELGHLVWGDLKFSENVISMETNFKTGIRRHIPFITSCQYIIQWKNDFPIQITKDTPVFISFQSKEVINYQTIFKHIRELSDVAGIKKHVSPHIFRHSRITHLIQKGTPESIVKMLAWGNLNTDMMGTYCHLADQDLDRAIFELNGITYDKKNFELSDAMESVECRNCGHINPPGIKFCGVCGSPLKPDAEEAVDITMKKIRKLLSTNPAYAMSVMQDLEKV